MRLKLITASLCVLGIITPSLSAQAGFLDSINNVRNVVGNIGQTANVITYSKQATQAMASDLGITKKDKAPETVIGNVSSAALSSGDILVGKLASTKLYANSDKTKIIATLAQSEPMVFIGQEKEGFLLVSSDKGEG